MIGKLKGIVDSFENNYLLLDVGGVCYLVFISEYSKQRLPAIGEAATLLIETHVREDHIHLYGFVSTEERQWFNILITVKGVGTKVALAFLSILAPDQLALALASQDVALLTRVNGVGKKLAERVITELKDKVGTLPSIVGTTTSNAGTAINNSVVADIVSALTSLGYGRAESFTVATKIATQDTDSPVEELIRTSLREIAL